MKAILFIALVSAIFCLGGWEKRSFAENDLGIDMAAKTAFAEYSKTNSGSEADWFERLTVYSQLVNGVNYKMCFYAIDGEPDTISEFVISSPPFSNPRGDYTLRDKNTLKATAENGKLLSSTTLGSLSTLLGEYTGANSVNIASVKSVENDDSIFYFVSTEEGKNAKYLVVQDKQENSLEVHSW